MVLTARESLEIMISNDSRNVASVTEWSPNPNIVGFILRVVADCALRFRDAKNLNDLELIRKAESNLHDATERYARFNGIS